MRRILAIAVMTAVLAALVPAAAQQSSIPQFWDVKERLARPDISDIPRIRFLTTIDFPPFNFIDDNGLLTGFHVDLARAICSELGIVERCQIQALPWEELTEAIDNGDGEAIIAGLAVTPEARGRFAFTRSFLRFPARFVVRQGTQLAEPMWRAISERQVGVVADSAHEAMLRDYFPEAEAAPFADEEALHAALRDGTVTVAFGDGMRFSFWLAGDVSAGCCAFAGGPYLAPEYFGGGLAIAVAPDEPRLAEAFDYALREINMSGTFEELYLRYFPVGFF